MRLKSIRKAHISKLAKRATAFVLALSMVLPGLPAFGAGSFTEPVKLTGEEEAPTIIIELNAVVNHELPASATEDEIKASLTGELEVVLKVKTGTITTTTGVGDSAETTVTPQLFNNVLVALEYSHWLTPSSFSGVEIKGITDAANLNSIKNMVNMESLKLNKNIATVVAQVSSKGTTDVTEGDDALTTTVPSGGGYLILGATAGRPLELTAEGDIVLGAVTFTYPLGSNGSDELQPIASAASNYLRDDSSAQLIRLVNPSVFFDDGDEITGAMAAREVTYNSATNSMYYSDAYYGGAESDYINAADEADLTEAEAAAVDTDGTIKVPKLGIFAADPDYTGSDPEEAYNKSSRLFNLLTLAGKGDVSYEYQTIQEHQVNFSLVNKVSYNPEKSSQNGVIIEFFDWDDTQLGALYVGKDEDARAAVNDYVRDNFIHPDLRIKSTDADAEDKVKSLTRADTYRGKYPTTAMSEEDAVDDPTIDLTGTKYKLTNKLDYVFFKRPMGHEGDAPDPTTYAVGDYATDGTLNPDYQAALAAWQAKWVQQSTTTPGEGGAEDTTTADWDAEYPYIHGWAITDLETVFAENRTMWTTLGVGELGQAAAIVGSGYSGANSFGAYVDLAGAPATLGTHDEDFVFADFNFGSEGNSQPAGSVYAVKAVYEPGSTQLQNPNYRMLSSEPYYTKLNTGGSTTGGAYQATVTFDRTTIVTEKVYGSARLREPSVRQDTTYDLRWEENEDLNVHHDLVNENNTSAYSGKAKTTYTLIPVNNTDEMTFSMTVSARQNKIDYYIMDQYGSNFVAGNTRIKEDITRSLPQRLLNNYNYYVAEDSDPDDEWHDASYETRDGSLGFVLYGTLNRVMEVATTYKETGAYVFPDDMDFVLQTTLPVVLDMNLKLPGGVDITEDNINDARAAIRNAALACKAAYNNGEGDPQWWNVEKNCAEMTYHQLQNYILHGSLLPDATEANMVDDLTWCHLHKACADANSTAPKTWSALIAAAGGDDDAKASIKSLTAGEIWSLFHLRKDGTGTKYTDAGLVNPINTFHDDIIAAVAAGCTTWDAVQDFIASGNAVTTHDALTPAQYSQATYWWYDGTDTAASVVFTSLGATVAAAADAVTAVAPTVAGDGGDGSTPAKRTAKINLLRAIFNANVTARGEDMSGDVTAAWRNATKNLAITRDVTYTPEGADDPVTDTGVENATFTSFETFRDLFVEALTKMKENSIDPLPPDASDDPDKTIRKYWNLIQYYILNKPGFVTTQEAEMDDYWWYDGNVNIRNLPELIRVAKQGKLSEDIFKLDMLYNESSPLYEFRSAFDGSKYADINDFISDFVDYANDEDSNLNTTNVNEIATLWNRAQYHIIHGGFAAGIATEAIQFYWWKENGSYEAVSFDIGDSDSAAMDRADSLAKSLIEAAFRKTYNGNDDAWNNLIGDDFANIVELGRLVAGINDDATIFPDHFTRFSSGDKTTFTSAITNMLPTLTITSSRVVAPTFNWHQIQNYLLESPDTPASADIESSDEINYWWKTDNELEAEVSPQDDFSAFVEKYIALAGGEDGADDAMREWFTIKRANNMGFTVNGADELNADMLAEIPWADLNFEDAGEPADFNWYQLQTLFILMFDTGDGPILLPPEDSEGLVLDYGIELPEWWDSYLTLGEFTPLSMELTALNQEKVKGRVVVRTTDIESVQSFLETLQSQVEADPAKYADLADVLEEILAHLRAGETQEEAAEAVTREETFAPAAEAEETQAIPTEETEISEPSAEEEEGQEEEAALADDQDETQEETTPAESADAVVAPKGDREEEEPSYNLIDFEVIQPIEEDTDAQPAETESVAEEEGPPEAGEGAEPDLLSYAWLRRPLYYYSGAYKSPPDPGTDPPMLLSYLPKILTYRRTTR